jgi:flagellar motor switch protein FliM
MIALVTINIKIGDVEGLMNICLPYITLEPVMDRLNTKFWYSNMKERTEMEYAEEIETTLTKVDVPVTAILGNSTISVADFSSLQVGDVVRLDSKVNQELTVYVGETEKFTALPGAVGDKYAVRITSVIREEQ